MSQIQTRINAPAKAVHLKKVMVIDPVQETRQLLVLRLEILGLEVLEAGDARGLKSLLESHAPELVVSEWSVPGLEGMDLLNILQPQKRHVLLFTENEAANILELLERTHVRGWVHKKKRSDLLDRIKTLMDEPVPTGFISKETSQRQILLIEDSGMVRGFVRRALAKAFPEVVIREAEDGKAAMTEMSQKKVDLIITDLEMPGMDGRTFLRKMRSNALLKTKPVMVLSGNITPDLLREFMEDPYIWFLEKPATPEEIVEIAGRLIRV